MSRPTRSGSAVRSGARSGRAPRAPSRSSSSAYQHPSPCLTGIVSRWPDSQRAVNGVSVRSTRDLDVRQMNASDVVRPQHARQQPGLAEDLEAVADPEHEPARRRRTARRRPSPARSGRSRRSGGSRRTRTRPGGRPPPSPRAAPPRRATWGRVGAERTERPERVPVVERAGERHDGDRAAAALLHVTLAHARQLDLVALDQRVREQLLAHPLDLRRAPRRRRRPRPRGRRRGRRAPRPTRKPSWRSELRDAWPCGSSMPAFGRTRTVALIASTTSGSAR